MMEARQFETILTSEEMQYARQQLAREPNPLEWSMIDAEWNEHCSYKSSKPVLKQLPTSSPRVLVGPGYDSGVVDVDDGYVLTLHIESHNHPSAIDPYGGAATGIGGVVRDILCMGTRPIALLDGLRFGDINESKHSKWIMKNVVRGIADYGNCIGVPTVAGEVEFDPCFERNCLVDVACLGLGRKNDLLLAQATHPGDSVFLIGGSTGRDGIHGASFASKQLAADAEGERSAVQIPDPFMKKLIIEAIIEANRTQIIRGCKDLGGGGLTTGLSEIADKGNSGVEAYLEKIPIREADMNSIEILISESQERMLCVVRSGSDEILETIMRKYEVPAARIGKVTSDKTITVLHHGRPIATLPTSFLANAPIINRKSRIPKLPRHENPIKPPTDLAKTLTELVATPNIASKEWIYRQYDHEVGIRTISKPGQADAAVLKLPNGKLAAIKLDGNSKYCDLDPYVGSASVLAECCRNIVATGATPIAMLDHCQFGDPNDEEIFWSFSMAVKGMADFAKAIDLPCVGGKVSFYNQDEVNGQPIKPSPIAVVLGLIDDVKHVTRMRFNQDGEFIIIVGKTMTELGGSEYYHMHNLTGTNPPSLDFQLEKRTELAVLECIKGGLVTACHDCSRGGIGVALVEMALSGNKGASVDLTNYQGKMRDDELLFSETNSRFILTTRDPNRVLEILSKQKIPGTDCGRVGGEALNMKMRTSGLSCKLDSLRDPYTNTLERVLNL